MRGSIKRVRIHQSTRTDQKSLAEEVRIAREREIFERRFYGEKASATFSEAVIGYLETGGSARFLEPLNLMFGKRQVATITQRDSDKAAATIYPDRAPATINRQVITPLSAVLGYASSRDLRDPIRLKRRREPEGRTRFLMPQLFGRDRAPYKAPGAFFVGHGLSSRRSL